MNNATLWGHIVEVIRLIRPKFFNKLTWLVVVAGLLLMSSPFWQSALVAFLDRSFEITVGLEDKTDWGFALVVLGLVYHVTTTSLEQFAKSRYLEHRAGPELDHDRQIFSQGREILPEDEYFQFMSDLNNDHSFRLPMATRVDSFTKFLEQPSNQFINTDLQAVTKKFVAAHHDLLVWVASEFFVYPDSQVGDDLRLCMHPALNIDRGGNGKQENVLKYSELSQELSSRVVAAKKSYGNFRQEIKRALVV